jgi:hypothetical protein
MAAGKHTFILEQGTTFDIRVDYKNNNGTPVNLTGYSARMHIRPQPTADTIYCRITGTPTADGTKIITTPVSGSVTLPATSGSLGLYISAYSSSLFTFTEGYYDIEIYSGSGVTEYVTRILEGKIKVTKNTTR